MDDDRWRRMTGLLRVREQRRQARERDRAERRRACASAEEALQRQESTLIAGMARLDEQARSVCARVVQAEWTGTEMTAYVAHLERARAALATERASVAAARTVLDVLRGEERRAGEALVKAMRAEQKAEALHGELSAERRRSARFVEELADDERNSARRLAGALRAP